jgi:hypothetical protein
MAPFVSTLPVFKVRDTIGESSFCVGKLSYIEQHPNFTVFYHVDKYHRLTKKSWIVNENFTEASTCFKTCTHPACLWFSTKPSNPMNFNNPKAMPALGSFVWARRRGDLQIEPHVLTGTPLSTRIAAHLLTAVGQNKTNSLQDNIEFEIWFLKHVLEFSKAQDLIRRRGMGEIKKYYDLKTDSEKIKPAPMQTEEERQAESMAELVKQDKRREAGLDAMAEADELDNKELVSTMQREAIGVGPDPEDILDEGGDLETVTAECEFCKMAECMWLANREFMVSCGLGNLPDHRFHSARKLARQVPLCPQTCKASAVCSVPPYGKDHGRDRCVEEWGALEASQMCCCRNSHCVP